MTGQEHRRGGMNPGGAMNARPGEQLSGPMCGATTGTWSVRPVAITDDPACRGGQDTDKHG